MRSHIKGIMLFAGIILMSCCAVADERPNAPIRDYALEDIDNTSEEYVYNRPELPDNLWDGYSMAPSRYADMKQGNLLLPVRAKPAWKDPSGLYLVWYGANEFYMNLPLIDGGQIVMQWADFSVGKNEYDFTVLEKMLKSYHSKRIRANLQVNGNRKPEWLFDEVPYIAGVKVDEQVNDPQGTLMYWYPSYIAYYRAFLAALGKFVEYSPYKDAIAGIRFNFNAVGTEKLTPPTSYPLNGIPLNAQLCSSYTYPDGADRSFETDWSVQQRVEYESAVFDQFIASFYPHTKIFVRNNLDDDVYEAHREMFESGVLSWFHTSSEPEPRGKSGEAQTLKFYEYGRTGKTACFAEAWSDCWGVQTDRVIPHFCSPLQWNYWRLLADLSAGVSRIAVRGSVLHVAMGGDAPGGFTATEDDRREIRHAIEFAYRYVGYHDRPYQAPGAFVALRYSNENQSTKTYPGDFGKYTLNLSTVTEDYTFLALRKQDHSEGVYCQGPESQRYGAFARRYVAGDSMQIALNPRFVKAIYDKDVVLRIIYLDSGTSSWNVQYGDWSFRVTNMGTGRWKCAQWNVRGARRLNALDTSWLFDQGMLANLNKNEIETLNADITISVTDGSVVFHMVEIDRSNLFQDIYEG